MEADVGEERMGSDGEDLHLSEEKKLMENAIYSISCLEPGGYFTYLALMLLQGQVVLFPSGMLRWKENHSLNSPYMTEKKMMCSCYNFSCFFSICS